MDYKSRFQKSTFYILFYIQATYSTFQHYQDYTSNFIKSRIIYISNNIHKLHKKQGKLRHNSHSTYKKLTTENGEQITQYETMG